MSLGAAIGAMLGGAAKITAAAANKNKNKGSGSSGSSGGSGSSGSSGSSGGGNRYGNFSNTATGGFQGSAEEYDRLTSLGQQLAQKWHETDDPVEKKSLHDQAVLNNAQLGKSYDDKTGTWSGGYARPREPENMSERTDYGDIYNDTFDKYYGDDAAKKQQEAIEAANKAAVDKNVLEMEAQKGKVSQAGEEGNRAAQEAYMQTIKPNGGLAESLAARGLLSSGLTESSQIAAGNAYQNALNNNKATVTEQLAEIERAISSAKLSGDLATAEQLQAWYNNVANAAMQNAQNIVSANQWQQQFQYNQGVTDAGLTGFYNGAPTMEYKRYQNEQKLLEKQLAEGRITQEDFDKMQQANYELLLQEIEKSKQEQKYNDWQMQQAGVR